MSASSTNQPPPSCPGLSRASTSTLSGSKDVDGRDRPGHDETRVRPAIKRFMIASAVVCALSMSAFAAWVVSLGPLPLAQAQQVSTTVVDRNGKLLRAYAMADGRWRLPVD